MKVNEGYGKIITDESLRETVSHGSEDYPFRYYLEDIWLFDFHCIDWHWHPEVEFVLIKKGTAEFLIGSGRYVLGEGTGIFINSQVIHRFEAAESVIIPNIVFSPSLLAAKDSLIYRKYIQPVLDAAADCMIFSADDSGQRDILETLSSVFAVQEAEKGCEIKTVELLLKLWRMVYENTDCTEKSSAPQSSVRTQAQLQIMLQYIHKNYPYQISLDDIAGTVALSKSSVLGIFHKNIHTSPIRYLVDYRLKRAAKLLVTTQSSVSAIARDSGFENVGYFCRKFKEVFRVTPGEYRKREGGKENK
ncbi:MAG: AraC family transcriptional regulator [Lachnospiraceae bacterium]|nr:AraC family transcriptional regulator [Lachnospiraceae bacterium]